MKSVQVFDKGLGGHVARVGWKQNRDGNPLDGPLWNRIRIDVEECLLHNRVRSLLLGPHSMEEYENETFSHDMDEADHYSVGNDHVERTTLAKDPKKISSILYDQQNCIRSIRSFPRPIVSMTNGLCLDSALGILTQSTHSIATETASCAVPATQLGLVPEAGLSFTLTRDPIGYPMGLYLAMTGSAVSGEDTIHEGLCTHFVPQTRLPLIIDTLNGLYHTSMERMIPALDAISSDVGTQGSFTPHKEAMDRCFGPSHTTVSSIVQALEAEGTTWAQKTLEAICTRAHPLALHATLSLFQKAKDAPMDACLDMEAQLISQLMPTPAHAELVSSALSGSRTPHGPTEWSHVSEADVASLWSSESGWTPLKLSGARLALLKRSLGDRAVEAVASLRETEAMLEEEVPMVSPEVTCKRMEEDDEIYLHQETYKMYRGRQGKRAWIPNRWEPLDNEDAY